MILSAGDLGIEIDFGMDKPGAILQRKEKDGYQYYLVEVSRSLIRLKTRVL